MKKGMCTFLACMTLSLTTQFAFAEVIVKNKVNEESGPLINVLKDYEVKVSKNPALEKEMVTELKSKIEAQVEGKTQEQLKLEMDSVINQIPDVEKRNLLKSKLQFASKEDIAKMMQNPSILSQSITGEGANFFTGIGSDPFITIVAVAIVALVIAAVIHDVNHQEFYSEPVYVSTYDDYCRDGEFELYSWEKELMEAQAYNRCSTQARNPETCKFVGYTEYYNGFGECKYRAKYEADK